jgi:RNA polymerase sigma-70 factor (ECF subfamily)
LELKRAHRGLLSVSTDSEILARSVVEPAAFAGIFERHASAVGGYARRRVGLDAVDDVLSETFLIAFRKRSSFVGEESARPWLLGIATRVIHRYRSSEERQWRASVAEPAQVVASHEASSDAALDASSAMRRLGPRIAALSPRERDVLLLFAWEGLTYEQIAAALSIPIGTVRSRLNRVRQKLAPPESGPAAPVTWMAKEETNALGR